MGEIHAQLTLENTGDRAHFRRGHGDESEIRRSTVDGVVDTGAVTLVLPQNVVERLGLQQQGTAFVTDVDEQRERPLAGPVTGADREPVDNHRLRRRAGGERAADRPDRPRGARPGRRRHERDADAAIPRLPDARGAMTSAIVGIAVAPVLARRVGECSPAFQERRDAAHADLKRQLNGNGDPDRSPDRPPRRVSRSGWGGSSRVLHRRHCSAPTERESRRVGRRWSRRRSSSALAGSAARPGNRTGQYQPQRRRATSWGRPTWWVASPSGGSAQKAARAPPSTCAAPS